MGPLDWSSLQLLLHQEDEERETDRKPERCAVYLFCCCWWLSSALFWCRKCKDIREVDIRVGNIGRNGRIVRVTVAVPVAETLTKWPVTTCGHENYKRYVDSRIAVRPRFQQIPTRLHPPGRHPARMRLRHSKVFEWHEQQPKTSDDNHKAMSPYCVSPVYNSFLPHSVRDVNCLCVPSPDVPWLSPSVSVSVRLWGHGQSVVKHPSRRYSFFCMLSMGSHILSVPLSIPVNTYTDSDTFIRL